LDSACNQWVDQTTVSGVPEYRYTINTVQIRQKQGHKRLSGGLDGQLMEQRLTYRALLHALDITFGTQMRPATGILLAPLLSAAIGAVFVGARSQNIETALLSFVLLALDGYGTALVFGWGFFLLLRRLAWLTPQSLAVAGAVGGLLFALLVSPILPARTGWLHAFLNLAGIGSPLGAAGGLAFWWLSVRKVSEAFHRQA